MRHSARQLVCLFKNGDVIKLKSKGWETRKDYRVMQTVGDWTGSWMKGEKCEYGLYLQKYNHMAKMLNFLDVLDFDVCNLM